MKAYLEPDEVERLEEAATNLRDRLLVRLLFRLGCRISELLGLQVKDIDFSQGTVVIQHLKSRVELFCNTCGARIGATHAFCPECGSKIESSRAEERLHRRQRSLPIDSDSLQLLKEYIRRGGPVVRDSKRLIFVPGRSRDENDLPMPILSMEERLSGQHLISCCVWPLPWLRIRPITRIQDQL